jgi:hypothetical protein
MVGERLITARRSAALALAGGVLLVHGLGVDRLAALAPAAPTAIQRITLAYVHELKPQAPPAAAPVPAPRIKRLRATAVAPAASAPPLPESTVLPLQAQALALDEPQFAELADASPAFEWPLSTRLAYRLQGHYRGALEGQAQVRWVHTGLRRYQVQMDVVIGLPIAPLMSRRVTSEGEVGDSGLLPQRYEETTRFGPAPPTTLQLGFGVGRVQLANGRHAPAPAGVQDSASQFVQLAWLFNTQPQRLRAGERIVLPLALPRRVGLWVYEVQAQEVLTTPLGDLATHALKPQPGAARPGELVVQMWIAPSLQYLPVRIRIEQGADTWIDLLIDEPPLQAAGDEPSPQAGG